MWKCYPPYYQLHFTLRHLLNFFPVPTTLFLTDNTLVWVFLWNRTHRTPTVSLRDSGEANPPRATCGACAPRHFLRRPLSSWPCEWSREGFLTPFWKIMAVEELFSFQIQPDPKPILLPHYSVKRPNTSLWMPISVGFPILWHRNSPII